MPVEWEVVVADNGSGTVPALAWNNGPSVTPHSAWWTPRPVEGRRRPATSGSVGPWPHCWPSVMPTTWYDQVGSPPWWQALADADLVAGVFDFGALDGLPARLQIPVATRQLGFLPFGLSANLAVRREAFEAVQGFDEDAVAGGGRRSVLAAATGRVPIRSATDRRGGEARA